MSHFEVVTRYSPELIEQSVVFPSQAALISAMTKNVIQLQDEGVKQALINLGWTPPSPTKVELSHTMTLESLELVIKMVKEYGDRDLSHFSADFDDGYWQLVAHLPGNGLFVGTMPVIKEFQGDIYKEYVTNWAKDLNTLFGLKVPT